MALPYELLKTLQTCLPAEAWSVIFEYSWKLCSQPLSSGNPKTEIIQRDCAIGDIDLFLATAGWNLWQDYEVEVERTSRALTNWWDAQSGGRAVLILDALSLRETPWLLKGVEERGYTIHQAKATGAELPADTTPFAKALGFSQRSSLNNNGAGSSHKLQGARTESVDIPWKECAEQIGVEPDWVFWHHWPDHRLHDHDTPGKGVSTLARETSENLTSNDFWQFIDRLATGRRVVITADHGYAASGLFPDSDKNQTDYLKREFRSGRWSDGNGGTSNWVPPIDLSLNTQHGTHHFVLGRRKWKSAGGYPTLTHGGLSVLEVAVPWIELSK